MANEYNNKITLGVTLKPTSEIQNELNSAIQQLEKNSSIDLKIDTNSINQSLKDFGDTLNNISNQIRNNFNFQGVFTNQASNVESVTNKLKEEQQAIEQTANTIKVLSNTKIAILNDDGSIKETLKDITKVEEGIGKIQTLTKDGKTGIVTAKIENNSEAQRKAEQEKQDILKQEIEAYKQIDVLKKNGIINEADITKLKKMVKEATSLKDMKNAMNSIMNTSMMNESSIVTISKQLEDAQNKLNKMKQSFNDKLLPNGFIESTETEINKLKEDLKNVDGMNFNGIKNSLNQVNNTIKLTNDNTQMLVKLENTTKLLQTKLNATSNNEFINPSVITELQNRLNSINTNTAEKEIKELQTTINNLSSSDSQIVRLQNAISKMETNLTNMRGKYGNLVGDSSSKEQLNSYISQIENLKTVLNSLQNGGTISGQKLASELNLGTNASRELSTAVKNSANALRLATTDSESFGQSVKRALSNTGIYMGTYQAVQMLSNSFRDAITYVVQLDSAMINLKKVTQETNETYSNFLNQAHNIAMEYGSQADKVVDATTSWAKTGESLKNATELAKSTMLLTKVGDVESVATAQQYMIAPLKAFNIEADKSITLIDKYNNISNNMATSTNDMGQALSKSASSMSTAGNTLEQTLALLATAESQTKLGGDVVGQAF